MGNKTYQVVFAITMILSTVGYGDVVMISAGNMDAFSTADGPELTSARAGLAAEIGNPNPQTHYDSVEDDRFFVETLSFPSVSQQIVAAIFEIRVQPLSVSSNDFLHLFATNWPTSNRDSYLFESLGGTLWQSGMAETFNLPISATVLSDINLNKRLDIYVQDDTAVDYVKLTLTTVPEPSTTVLFTVTALMVNLRRTRYRH